MRGRRMDQAATEGSAMSPEMRRLSALGSTRSQTINSEVHTHVTYIANQRLSCLRNSALMCKADMSKRRTWLRSHIRIEWWQSYQESRRAHNLILVNQMSISPLARFESPLPRVSSLPSTQTHAWIMDISSSLGWLSLKHRFPSRIPGHDTPFNI